VNGQSKFGQCHLCGFVKKLSFEHVPPQSAFNNRPIINPDIRRLLLGSHDDLSHLDRLKGPIQQRGAGAFTLCVNCNQRTGKLYAPSYGYWVRQAARALVQSSFAPSVAISFDVFPLRVLKQIACMFLSANSPRFQDVQTDLVRFVINQHALGFPSHLRIYAYCTTSDRSRQAGVTGVLNMEGGALRHHVFSEISFPPFGYLLTIDSDPIDSRLVDISQFGTFPYDQRATLTIPLRRLTVFTPFPGDFRSREEVHREAACP
jgi:hypothetical protein